MSGILIVDDDGEFFEICALMARLDRYRVVFAGRMTRAGRGFLIGAAAVLLMTCGGASTPTQPTTSTTPASSIQITGPMVLATGGTTQLVATITTGGTTTGVSNATWQSQSPQIATVSSTGLVTGVSPGQAFISASANGVTGRTFVTVQPTPTGTTVVSACGTISSPGNYTLASDLAGNSSCLLISNVAGVHLDCGGRTLSGVSMINVSAVTVADCSVSSETDLETVTSVTVMHSVFNNGLSIGKSQSVIVSDSTITSATIPVYSSLGNDVELLRDVISNTGSGLTATGGVVLFNGSNNRIEQTTISSGYDGGPALAGADDGIVLNTEASDTIRGNTIRGFFDIGVEGLGALTSATIIENLFSNIGKGGVGSYYCTDWTNNTVQGNHVSESATLVFVGYQQDTAHCGATSPPATFTNNQFIGNVFRSPIHSMVNTSGRGPSMSVVLQNTGAAVSGNVLQNNDFASFDGPDLNPLNGFIDGGGNICGPLDPEFSNFVCTGGSASTGGFAIFRTPRR